MSLLPLSPQIEISPGSNPVGDASLFRWQSAGSRRAKVNIGITAGRDDEASETEAGSLSVTMDDRDGNLSPRNRLGQWYGKLGRGTPLRTTLDRVSDDFTRSGSGSGLGTTTDGFSWTSLISGSTYSHDTTRGISTITTAGIFAMAVLEDVGSPDVEVTWSTTLPVAPTVAAYVSGAVLRCLDSSNYVRVQAEFRQDGVMTVKMSSFVDGVGTDILANTATTVTYVAGDKVRAKARADGPYIMVKVWNVTAGQTEPTAWHGVATDRGPTGARVGVLNWRLNTNAGSFTAYIDDFVVTNILWSGVVPEWPPRWPDKSGNDSIVEIAAAGILRRLGQGSSPLLSPLTHQLGSLSYTGAYYPGEDSSGATQVASGIPGGRPANVVDATFAGDDTLPGASTSIVLNTANHSEIYAGQIATVSTPTGFSAMLLCKLTTLPASTVSLFEFSASGTVSRWYVELGAGAFGFEGYDRDSTLIANGAATYIIDPTQWFALQFETSVSGGTVTATLIWHQVGATTYYSVGDTYSGTISRSPNEFVVRCPTDNVSVGHIWFGDQALPFVNDTFSLVSDGYRGELAADRISRLCSENDIPAVVYSGDSEPMGRQKAAKLVDLLRECENADQGVLFERGLALGYLPRSRRYNLPVALALDWAAGDLAEPPEPVDDDQRLRNQWTVTRTDGSSATASNAASIELEGLYDDSTEVNILFDERLVDFASWLTMVGTGNYLRWPRITINLVAHPELIGQWLASGIGSRVTVANPPSQILGETIDLIIEGYTETINQYVWTVELACSPAQPWDVAVYGTDRYDSVSSFLQTTTLSASATSLKIITTDQRTPWSTTAPPYLITLGGEDMTVTAMTATNADDLGTETFETTTQNFSGSNCTFVRSSAQAHAGTWSGLATVTGSPSSASAVKTAAAAPAVIPGVGYIYRLWVRTPTLLGDVRATVGWYDEYGDFISKDDAGGSLAANTWVQREVVTTAPAGAVTARFGLLIASSPATGSQVYIDDSRFFTNTGYYQTATVTRAVNGVARAHAAGEQFRLAATPRYAL